MENNLRDTPLRRFTTFWWGLGLFVAFGLAIVIIANIVQGDEVPSADKERGKVRLLIKEQVDAEQNALLMPKKTEDKVQLPPNALFPIASEIKLLNTTPADSGVAHGK